MPLHEFWPLQALLADLQALVPLQLLMPLQCTGAFLACAEVVRPAPETARAMAAAARLAPEMIFICMVELPEDIALARER
jgi:hypothetical protein